MAQRRCERRDDKRTNDNRTRARSQSLQTRSNRCFPFFFLTSDFVPCLFLMKDTSQSVEFVFVFRQTFVNNMSHAFRRATHLKKNLTIYVLAFVSFHDRVVSGCRFGSVRLRLSKIALLHSHLFSCSDLCIVRLSTCLASVARALASLFGVRRGLQVLARRGVPKCAVNAISRPASSRSHHIVFREIDGEFV